MCYHNYFVVIEYPGIYKIALRTDDPKFGGLNPVDANSKYVAYDCHCQGRKCIVHIGIPSRCGFGLKLGR
jgi:1,4-alpha-glucan branching enzyme